MRNQSGSPSKPTEQTPRPAKIGPVLRAERLQAGLKQSDVSLAAEINLWRLLKAEKGHIELSGDEVARVRAAIDRLGRIEVQRQAALSGQR